MKELFNKKLYFEGLRQIKLHGFFLTLVSILIAGIAPFWHFVNYMQGRGYDQILNPLKAQWMNVAMMYILPVVFGFALFSYLMKRKSCDFYHAIPVKRQTHVISFALAGATYIVVSMLAVNLFTSAFLALTKTTHFSFGGNVLLFLNTTAGALAIFAAVILAISITGQKFTAFVISCLIVGLPMGLIELFRLGADNVIYSGIFLAENFAPTAVFESMFSYGMEDNFTSLFSTANTFIVAILLFVIACYAFTKRKSELAGNSAQNKYIQYVFQGVIAIPMLALAAALACNGVSSGYKLGTSEMMLIGVMVLVSLIIFVAFEIITKHSAKNIVKSLPVFCIAVAVAVGFGGAMIGTSYYIDNTNIDVNDVKYVEFHSGSVMTGYCPNDYMEAIYQHEFTDSEIIEIVVNGLKKPDRNDTYQGRMYVEIGKSFGRSIERKVYLTDAEMIDVFKKINSLTEYDNLRIEIPKIEDVESFDLALRNTSNDQAEMALIMESFYKEFDLLNNSQKQELLKDARFSSRGIDSVVNNGLTGNTGVNIRTYEYYAMSTYRINVTPLLPKTFDMIVDFNNNINKQELIVLEKVKDGYLHNTELRMSLVKDNKDLLAVGNDTISDGNTEYYFDNDVPIKNVLTLRINSEQLDVVLEIIENAINRHIDYENYVDYAIQTTLADDINEGHRSEFKGTATFTEEEIATLRKIYQDEIIEEQK